MRQFMKISMLPAMVFCVFGDAEAGWNADRIRAMELRESGRHGEAYETAVGNGSKSRSDAYDRNFLAGWIALRGLNRPSLAVEHFREMNSVIRELRRNGKGNSTAESKSWYWLAKALLLEGRIELSRSFMARAGEAVDTFYGQLALAELGISPELEDIVRFSADYPDFQYYWHDDRVEKEIVLALIREESGFDAAARSRAGAIGIMQVMPATAEEIGLSNRVRTDEEKLKTSPDYNIAFGSNYFARLLERYQGHAMLAIAAYNAGPSNVDNWLEKFGDPRNEGVDPIEWVESIPFRETRRYVKRVLSSYVLYQILSKSKGKLNSE